MRSKREGRMDKQLSLLRKPVPHFGTAAPRDPTGHPLSRSGIDFSCRGGAASGKAVEEGCPLPVEAAGRGGWWPRRCGRIARPGGRGRTRQALSPGVLLAGAFLGSYRCAPGRAGQLPGPPDEGPVGSLMPRASMRALLHMSGVDHTPFGSARKTDAAAKADSATRRRWSAGRLTGTSASASEASIM